MFDPNELISQEVSGEMSTEYKKIPAGEHRSVIASVEGKSIPTKNGEVPVLEVMHQIDNPALEAELGRKATVRQTLWLDLNESGTGLDLSEGKNVQLGRLRAAVGQNSGGAWAPGMLVGQVCTIRGEHQASKKDPDKVFEQVAGVAAAA